MFTYGVVYLLHDNWHDAVFTARCVAAEYPRCDQNIPGLSCEGWPESNQSNLCLVHSSRSVLKDLKKFHSTKSGVPV
jgi:hypothetical protein